MVESNFVCVSVFGVRRRPQRSDGSPQGRHAGRHGTGRLHNRRAQETSHLGPQFPRRIPPPNLRPAADELNQNRPVLVS